MVETGQCTSRYWTQCACQVSYPSVV